MTSLRVYALVVAASLCLVPVASGQGTAARRWAIVVGSNMGTGERPPLRYAEADADRFARVLLEIGNVAPADVTVLKGAPADRLEQAFADVRERIAAHRARGGKALLLVYFSGHADAQGLELGKHRLDFAQFKSLVRSSGADVRLGIVDACHSAAMLRVGGRPAPSFDIDVDDQLTTSGEAFITSSGADESAVESSELEGSLFTHHFVAGLRGAADRSGDGLVSLDEAYRYAYVRTAAGGVQHPGFGLRLDGHGELVLAWLKRAASTLELPERAERIDVFDAAGALVAHLDGSSARVLALPPGRYEIRARKGGQLLEGRLSLARGRRGRLDWGDLAAAKATAGLEVTRTASGAPPRAAVFVRAADAELARKVAAELAAAGVEIAPESRADWTIELFGGPTELTARIARLGGKGIREIRLALDEPVGEQLARQLRGAE